MRFVDTGWLVITSVISNSWRFTQTLLPGTYTFIAEWEDSEGDDWSYYEALELDGTTDPLYAPTPEFIGLLPGQEIYLPLLFKPTS